MFKTITSCLMAVAISLPAAAHHTGRGRTVTASVYAEEFHGQTTASGETFWWWSPDQCAHPWLPFGTRVQLRHRGRTATCRIVDRLPLSRIDLSRGVANRLGLGPYDLAQVELTEL